MPRNATFIGVPSGWATTAQIFHVVPAGWANCPSMRFVLGSPVSKMCTASQPGADAAMPGHVSAPVAGLLSVSMAMASFAAFGTVIAFSSAETCTTPPLTRMRSATRSV